MKALDYYAFGMQMPSRTYNSDDYRYGFNGAEKDDEIKGSGNHYDLGLRNYDPRIGRMFSMDPRANEYPWQTTYAYHRNSPIMTIDYLGGGDGIYKDIETGEEIFDDEVDDGEVHYVCREDLCSNEGASRAIDQTPEQRKEKLSSIVLPEPKKPKPSSSPSSPPHNNVEGNPSSVTDWAGGLLAGAKEGAEGADNLWVKKKDGKIYKGSQVSSSKVLKGSYSTAAKTAAKRVPVVGAIMSTTEIAGGMVKDGGFGKNATVETAGAVGSAAGAAGGAWAGSAGGAAIGSVVPVLGTAVGAVVGGVVGSVFGAWGGEQAAESVTKKVIE
jgi:RHS repeat-associated protein